MSPRSGLAAVFGLLAASVGAQVLPIERRFAQDASRGNLAETTLGQLAMERGTSPAIRQFGRRMVEDHGKAQMRLATIMRAKRMPIPRSMGPEAQALYERLRKLRGGAFDRAYRQAMIVDHQNDVAAYDRISKRGSDPEIRVYATKTLPTLRMHLSMIRATKA